MRDLLEEVLSLQDEWSPDNTPGMARRGHLVRHEVPAWLRGQASELAHEAAVDDLLVEGRDAIGLKSRVPWVRLASKSRSPRPTEGWYAVYLVAADGHAIYLSLNQGTTVPVASSFRPKHPDILIASVAWARDVIGPAVANHPRWQRDISLRVSGGHHGAAYELGNVGGFRYDRGSVPEPAVLRDDARFVCRLLGELYRAREVSTDPGDIEPEVSAALDQVADLAGKDVRRRRGGQGFRPSAAERRAIELRGMAVAEDYFGDLGWACRNVSSTESFDLIVTKGGRSLAVEVKATTSLGDRVLVTHAEVAEQRRRAPANGLFVVHSIQLDRTSTPPTATGGVFEFTSPWHIEEARLEPIAYTYRRR